MDVLLSEKWELQAKHSSTEVLQRWRDLCAVLKNPKRRFRFTANLSKRYEVAEMRKTNQEKLRISVLVAKAAFIFINGAKSSDYTVPKEVKAAGFKICADELGSIVEGHDLKRLEFHGGVAGIVYKLATDASNGLATTDIDLSRREKIFGINKFKEREARSFWVFVRKALQDSKLKIPRICALVSMGFGITNEGWPTGAHNGLGLVAVMLLAVLVRATKDYGEYLTLRDLDKEKKMKISIQVTRNGYRQKLSIYEILPGDVVHLSIGDQVPADGIFLSGFSVMINKSSLTGESEPATVNADKPFLLSGTKVQDGTCKMLVTAVGMKTQWGKLMETSSEGEAEDEDETRLNGDATIIGNIGFAFAFVSWEVLVQKLIGCKWQAGIALTLLVSEALELLEHFAIAAVPEGAARAVALSLAFAVQKKMNDRALVRHLVGMLMSPQGSECESSCSFVEEV
ncbi:calcium ATPase 2 [Perilla frutescens var. frutescens]|nr:calcium ATPase 2 [Perilla frutescens var. frutescens]